MNYINTKLQLSRADLVEMEGMLCDYLSDFFAFLGHALYFPTENVLDEPKYLQAERKLLLPLVWRDQNLGAIMMHGVTAKQIRPLLPSLPAIVNICLENLAMIRSTRIDSVTGLFTRDELFAKIESETTRVRNNLDNPARPDSRNASPMRSCMGLVLVRLVNGHNLAQQYGFAFCDLLLSKLAKECLDSLPPDVMVAHVDRYDFALLLSTSGRSVCHRLAQTVINRMESVNLLDKASGHLVHPILCAGHAIYPLDMHWSEVNLDMLEQSRRLMSRASLAVEIVARGSNMKNTVAGRIMPFARILQDGGIVLEIISQDRLRISIGTQAKAREGLRFAVWSKMESGKVSAYKGEIVLLQVAELDSIAEILHLEDPVVLPEVGDSLSLLDVTPSLVPLDMETSVDEPAKLLEWNEIEELSPLAGLSVGSVFDKDSEKNVSAFNAHGSHNSHENGATTDDGVSDNNNFIKLLSHSAFLKRFVQARDHYSRFTFVILRISNIDNSFTDIEASLELAISCWQETMAQFLEQENLRDLELAFAGRYGSNSLVFFHPAKTAEALLPSYSHLCTLLSKHDLKAAAGLASYPFLKYRKAEMQDCALKALDYALLLPEPHAGICNSVALNISADKRYSLGDIFSAIEEYKMALLADQDNTIARNSLGVCMAALGRANDARRYLSEAAKRCSDQAQQAEIYYNLGNVCQNMGEKRSAANYYRQCLNAQPEHVFSLIRLGQLSEQGGRKKSAIAFYEQAAEIEKKQTGKSSLAVRHLARISAKPKKNMEARELLYETINNNPMDSAAMLLLAKLYLDSNEDPSVAEMFARKSLGLRERPEAWQVLARALRALGKEAEAREADARSLL